jgi:hypothetical protein
LGRLKVNQPPSSSNQEVVGFAGAVKSESALQPQNRGSDYHRRDAHVNEYHDESPPCSQGKGCAFCERPFDEIHLADHKPALLNPEGVTIEWRQVPVAVVLEAMARCLPVCWNCHFAQTFRREHTDLVVDRTIPPIDYTKATHLYN